MDCIPNIWAYVVWLYLGQFSTNQAQISYGNSGDYYLSISDEISGTGPYFKFLNFWALIWPQKGCGPTLCLKGPGTQDPTKKLAYGMELLGYTLSQNHVSKNFRPEPEYS